METPLFFRNGTENLFGVLHAPDEERPEFGILLCHAFGEEKLWSHRVFVNLAREAVQRRMAVFRFDFRGHGDSDGESENSDMASYLSDISAAINTFRSNCPSVTDIGLLGLRFGASLALVHASRHAEISRLALWEPIVRGDRYMQELLRINLSTQLASYGRVQRDRKTLVEQMESGLHANVDGYLISNEFYEQSNDINLPDIDLSNQETPILITQVAPNIKQKDRTELVDLVARHANSTFLKVEEPPFWREVKPFTSRSRSLVRETLDWWEGQIGS